MRRLRMPHRLIMLAAALCALLLVSRGAGISQAAAVPTSVSTSPVTGQQGKMLLFFATPAGGGETSVACASIDAAVFDPPNLVLKEMPQSGNPCEGGTPDAFVLPGMTTITAGVYVGGSQTAEKQVTTTVDVGNQTLFVLDGAALTADTVGDADCNRTANSVDALHVLRSLASLGDTACLQAGNVKCDDGLTAVDALLILRHVAGLSLSLPQGCPSPFGAPALVSPADGEVVHTTVERKIPLDWDGVGGAPQYTVQVDCAGCCAGGQYCSDVGRAYRFAAGLADSNYTVSVAGDNLERWRVWVINDDGTPGDFSDWRTFDVDSSGAVR